MTHYSMVMNIVVWCLLVLDKSTLALARSDWLHKNSYLFENLRARHYDMFAKDDFSHLFKKIGNGIAERYR